MNIDQFVDMNTGKPVLKMYITVSFNRGEAAQKCIIDVSRFGKLNSLSKENVLSAIRDEFKYAGVAIADAVNAECD